MVDFQNETTIGTPAVDIVRVLILQRRADLFEAWEDYNKKNNQGMGIGNHVVGARLVSLFLEMQPGLKRRLKKEDYDKLEKDSKSEDDEVIEATMYRLNEELDTIRLLRIDTKRQYDRSVAERENEEKGV